METDQWFIVREEKYKWIENLKTNKIMKAKEKAKELFDKYYSYLKANLMHDEEAIEDAKVCALIAVDEIINDNPNIYDNDRLNFKYWQEVKKEIEKL